MAWTTPKTWASEPLTSADLNTYMRDNQNHLYNGWAGDSYERNAGGSWTTTSSGWVDVDATNLASTITTSGGDVLVVFAGSAKCSASAGLFQFGLDVDGAAKQGIVNLVDDANHDSNASFSYILTGLSAGSHTIKLQWRTGSGTATLQGARTVFWAVREIAGTT